jgi:L-lactate dehydrogenase complex protein LldG
MSDARARILATLRSAQQTARLPVADRPPARPEPARRTTQECIDRFRAELAALGVDCYLESSAEGLRRRVVTLVDRRRILSWDSDLLPYGLGSLVRSATLGQHVRDRQAEAEVGLTGCDAAIAETGSLVLLSGKGKSRAISLLPPVHLAVVQPKDLCFSMGEFFQTHAERVTASASCTFVTGPSRTADIELTLTLGVHGPGKVIVLVGPDD